MIFWIGMYYILTLLSYYAFPDKDTRTIVSSVISLFAIKDLGRGNYPLFIFLGCAGTITEMLYIKMNGTWDYRQKNRCMLDLVPFWLIPLWSLAAVLIYSITTRVIGTMT